MILARTAADDHRDIQVLKTYGAAPYAAALKKLEKQIKEKQTSVNEKIGRLRPTRPQIVIHREGC